MLSGPSRSGSPWPMALVLVAVAAAGTILGAGLLRGASHATASLPPPSLATLGPTFVAAATAEPADTAEPTKSPSPSPSPAPTPAGPTGQPATATVGSSRIDGADPHGNWQVHVVYPRVLGLGTTGDAINADLKTQMDIQVQSFEQGPAATEPAAPGQPNQFTSSFGVALQTVRLLSLRVQTTQDLTGAAHPSSAIQTFTFDLRTGQEIGFADLFTDQGAALQILSQVTPGLLRQQLGSDYDAAQVAFGTGPQPGNFSAWALTRPGLEITFGEYQVGPYAIGMPRVVVPWSRLAPAVDPAGPAGALTR